MKRAPCSTCPWRKSTPKKGFPGGCIDTYRLLRMARGDFCPAMQCHSTKDDRPQVCVGFALVVGYQSVGLRMATASGMYDPDTIKADAPLHTLESVIMRHGGK